MKRLNSLSYGNKTLLFSLFFLIGCSLEHRIDDESQLKEGDAKVRLHVMIPDLHQTPLASRASEISNMVVMTFGSTAPYYLKDAPQPCIIEFPDTPDESYYVATLTATTDPRLVVIVANASAALLSYTYVVDVTTLADVELFKTQALATSVIGGTTYITQHPEIACMEGRVTLPSIQNGMIITDSSNPVPLTRGTAQIVVDSSPVQVTDLEILGASLCNAPLRGFIFPQPTIATSGEAHYHYTSSTTAFVPFVGAVTPQRSEPLYCYEDSKDNELFVLLEANYKGVHCYYRINMVDGILSDFDYDRHPIDIKRNTLYTVNIYKASNYGYSTITEAINNRASNIEYTVTAYVPSSEQYEDAHDIIFNGDYFLGVSNSIFVSYSAGATGVIATTLTHSAASTVTTATISVSGAGLTLVTPSSGTFNPVALYTKLNIEVSMSPSFTSGFITIVLGTITKQIEVIQKPPIPFVAGVVDDFADTEHFTGMLIPSGMPSVVPQWIKFSANADGSNGVESISSLMGNIYLVFEHNMVMSGGSVRSGAVYLTRNDERGRVKALFIQPCLNAIGITDNTPFDVNTYVGAFWKANQTGERLIRITRPTSDVIDGQWTAVALVGDSWIKLDKLPSTDVGVWTSGGPAMNGNDLGFDALHTVLGTATSVFGRMGPTAPDNEIYFRIGLRSTYTPTLSDPARYGLVLLASAEGSILQRIFIRQGEQADYVMRQSDAGSGISVRPDAKPFSTYNLKDPGENTQTSYGSVPDVGVNGATFVDYPTQAGYFFHWSNNNKAFHPTNPSGPFTGWVSSSFPINNTLWNSATDEMCPPNYRHPQDGDPASYNLTGNITGSEIRQSLWLDPVAGGDPSVAGVGNTHNSVVGYYADGWFDRREIENAVSGMTSRPLSVTSPTTSGAAYYGRLFYNPNNYASLFFPISGFREANVGELLYAGNITLYWTSTSYNNIGLGTQLQYYVWTLLLNSTLAQMYAVIKQPGFSVRCVYDPDPPIQFSLSLATIDPDVTYANYQTAPNRWQKNGVGSNYLYMMDKIVVNSTGGIPAITKWAPGTQTVSWFATNGTNFTLSDGIPVNQNGTYSVYLENFSGGVVHTITTSSIRDGSTTMPYLLINYATASSLVSSVTGIDLFVPHYLQTSDLTKDYELYENITMPTPVGGNNWTPLTSVFTGNLDGNSHAINGLSMNLSTGVSMFGDIDGGSVINLALTQVNLVGGVGNGALAQVATHNALIENCFVTGSITGTAFSGGFVCGLQSDAIIRNCYTTVDITTVAGSSSWSSIGGIASYATWGGVSVLEAGTIVNCYATGTFNGRDNYNAGIVGYITGNDVVSNCYGLNNAISGTLGMPAQRIFSTNNPVTPPADPQIYNNYGFNEVLLNDAPVSSVVAGSVHGADITFTQATTQTHYQSTGGWGFDAAGPWTFSYTAGSAFVGAGTNLPILKSFTGVVQNPILIQKNLYINVSQNSLTFAACDYGSIGAQTVTVSTNVPAGWSYSVSGVNASDYTVSRSGNVLTIYPNISRCCPPLTATVTVAAGSLTQTISLTQDPTWRFNYTGGPQTFIAGCSGTFKIELWGASGNNVAAGGGYVSGEIYLTSGTVLNIYVGGQGNTSTAGSTAIIPGGWNGGGDAYPYSTDGNCGSGGGGTDIRIGGTTYSDRIMVAGGGGGIVAASNPTYGAGGGWSGITCSVTFGSVFQATGGSQTAGGAPTGTITTPVHALLNGTFGEGGKGGQAGLALGQSTNYTLSHRAGGGGGYYGGGCYVLAGGGGSSFINGLFSDTITIPGNDPTMPNPNGGFMTGNAGHGVAIITYVGL